MVSNVEALSPNVMARSVVCAVFPVNLRVAPPVLFPSVISPFAAVVGAPKLLAPEPTFPIVLNSKIPALMVVAPT